MLNIAVFGLGYVGCVNLGCLAQAGHQMVGVDVISSKVDRINSGRPTILEKDIDTIIHEQWQKGRISATCDFQIAMKNADISLICVGTPSTQDGRLDYTALENTAQQIGLGLKSSEGFHVIAIRSTVLPGACRMIRNIIEESSGKSQDIDFAVVSNPEFMREGSSVQDFLHPPMILLGSKNQKALDVMREMYANLDAPVEETVEETAELLKSINNSYHALKVSFANEIGRICKRLNLDGHEVMRLFCMDKHLNLSASYLMPAFAFGGSCLPKDLKALRNLANELDLQTPLIDSIERSNTRHIKAAMNMIQQTGKKKIGLLGISFKAGTDDLRDSPAVELLNALISQEYQVGVYDPGVILADILGSNKDYMDAHIPQLPGMMYENLEDLVADSEILVVIHKNKDYENLETKYSGKIVIDLARVSKSKSGGNYHGIAW